MKYQHLGWPVSPYSAKTRTYLRFKQIPHDDVIPSAWTLLTRVRKAVGRVIMPTVITPEGEFWQDTSEIIDALEQRFPERPIVPKTPRQKLAAYLLEFHGDEWLPGIALYYRWCKPENTRFAVGEFGRYAAPWLPGFLSRPLGQKMASKMQSYLAVVGAVGDAKAGFEAFAAGLLQQLEAHLAVHPFLLGTRPCIGDFAIFGPIWAHLYRDAGTTSMFDAFPQIRAWFQRLLEPSGEAGAFLPDDRVPETLDPLFQVLFREQFVYTRALLEKIHQYVEQHPEATRVPRALGMHPFRMGGVAGERKLITFTQWMAQRPLDAYHDAPDADKEVLDAWLARVGGEDLPHTQITHRIARRDFKEVLQRSLP